MSDDTTSIVSHLNELGQKVLRRAGSGVGAGPCVA